MILNARYISFSPSTFHLLKMTEEISYLIISFFSFMNLIKMFYMSFTLLSVYFIIKKYDYKKNGVFLWERKLFMKLQ